jgi:hypothetical protein
VNTLELVQELDRHIEALAPHREDASWDILSAREARQKILQPPHSETSDNVDLLLAALLLGRNEPMQPHRIAWIRERLGHLSDDELLEFVRTGRKV